MTWRIGVVRARWTDARADTPAPIAKRAITGAINQAAGLVCIVPVWPSLTRCGHRDADAVAPRPTLAAPAARAGRRQALSGDGRLPRARRCLQPRSGGADLCRRVAARIASRGAGGANLVRRPLCWGGRAAEGDRLVGEARGGGRPGATRHCPMPDGESGRTDGTMRNGQVTSSPTAFRTSSPSISSLTPPSPACRPLVGSQAGGRSRHGVLRHQPAGVPRSRGRARRARRARSGALRRAARAAVRFSSDTTGAGGGPAAVATERARAAARGGVSRSADAATQRVTGDSRRPSRAAVCAPFPIP